MADAPAPLPTRSPVWLLVPVAGFAVVSLLAGFLADAKLDTGGYFDLFFKDTIHLKVWLASAAAVLALVQLFTAAWIFRKLRGRAQPGFRASTGGAAGSRSSPHPSPVPTASSARLPERQRPRSRTLPPGLRVLRGVHRQGSRRAPAPLPALGASDRWRPALPRLDRGLVHERPVVLPNRRRRAQGDERLIRVAREYPTVLDLVGGTPLVRLQRVGRSSGRRSSPSSSI